MVAKNNPYEIELKPVSTQKASEVIYEQIKNLIIHGDLKPGDRLPSERKMMTMLQRSRPPIREALRMLERAGLIKTIAGSGGAIVMEISSETIEQPLENMLSLNQITNKELLEYREIHEVASAGWAAERRTADDLIALEQCIGAAEAVVNNFEKFIEYDTHFHELIATAGHNKIANIVYRVISRMVINILHDAYLYSSEEQRYTMSLEVLQMHKKLLDAIRSQDVNQTQELMDYHIKRFKGDLKL